ncbi:MAG: DUF4293 domain-containing protein [Bacteroidales bacterium]|nr:DUF4293 domain-containing protein [Bacteroidales bacterium]
MFWFTGDMWWLILAGVAAFMELIALGAYKYRIFQMRTTVIAALLLIGLQIWMLVVYFISDDKSDFNITMVFPAVAAILDALAVRGILFDESLVRSASRLRSPRKRHK